MPRQTESDRLLETSVKQMVGRRSAAKQKLQIAFAQHLFDNTLIDDLRSLSAKVLGAVIGKAYDAFGDRPKTLVDVTEIGEGKTLVLLTLKNRPFIVDSVLGEINAHEAAIDLVAHPVLTHDNGARSSLMVVVIDKMAPARAKRLKSNLKNILKQVCLVTDDWRPMLLRVDEELETMRTTPPPLPTDQIAEAVQFLEWLKDDNFTLLGAREYSYTGNSKTGDLIPVAKSALGILRDDNITIMTRGGEPVMVTPEIRDFLFSDDPLIITKANVRSRVHRRTHLDYIGIKRFTDDGKLAGELRVVGLFTSTAYTRSVLRIPLLRYKANAVLEQFDALKDSHSGKALVNILETWPRDELFQIDVDTLAEFAGIAMQMEERPRVRVLARSDKFDRFVSIVSFVPRDRYDSDVRRRMGDYFATVFDGYLSAFYPAFLDNGMVRIQFIIGRVDGKTPHVSRERLEQEVVSITRTWSDRLTALADSTKQPVETGTVFPLAYQDDNDPVEALDDVSLMASLQDGSQIALRFHDKGAGDDAEETRNQIGLKLFHLNTPVALSRRVPLLENIGFRVIEESTYEVARADGSVIFIHDMLLETANGVAVERRTVEEALTDALHAVWRGAADDDSFNALVLTTGMDWRKASVFRAYARYLRQIRSRFTIESMADTLGRYTEITRDLAALFDARFDPSIKGKGKKEEALTASITASLDGVSSSDDDRILRNVLNLIDATLRTNFYAPSLFEEGSEEAPTPVLAFKVDPSAVKIMPQPVPYREIFVSSPRVEGLHLRFGPVARGGLRWSDRAQDYRTEVLGLVKAQQVKNAVIVPVGSKGGFVPKQLPPRDQRDAWFEEGRGAYKVFISSLLSVTDNLVEGKVIPPKGVTRRDGDDPYFVVAADKGTSTFSDTANAISQAKDFWLDDAFASGGSAGYDHKKMGITARGGWEAVKRHFREIDRDGQSWDIQEQPFTVAGVGDMSGDVFGNGMLLSKKTRLIAAFDHRDIFIDPNPDEAASFKERQRLFNAGRSSWQDYKTDLISKGGGVFSRSAKKITLSKAAADPIGFTAGDHTPQDVLNAILKAPVDLMWFGGIGTYIRASHESDADADDRGNDPIRVTAKELRCKVIGEGANLGVTHPARIEFNQLGGRCNSDAIDNSAGVNSSDVEVNIKIALADAMKSGRLSRTKRNTLLESMTENVAELVLRNNYLQTLSISLSQRRGMEAMPHQHRLMQSLEARGLLDREVEDLPDDIVLAERRAAGQPFTRAEIGVLLAYAKIVALDDLVASEVPDDPYLRSLLVDYFPTKMQKPYGKEIDNHRLRREIIGTVLANSMINRGGPAFINRVGDRTGASIGEIARAYSVVRDAFGMRELNDAIDALDAKIAGDLQLELYSIIQERVISQTIWFVRYGDFGKGLEPEAKRYRKAVDRLMPKLEKIVPDFLADRIRSDAERYQENGVPKALALALARLPIGGLIPDILFASQRSGKTLDDAAKTFFEITETFRVGRMVQAARDITTEDYYDGLALDRALQSLHQARRDIVVDILKSKGGSTKWLAAHAEDVDRTRKQMAGIIENDQATVSRLTVAANILADLVRA